MFLLALTLYSLLFSHIFLCFPHTYSSYSALTQTTRVKLCKSKFSYANLAGSATPCFVELSHKRIFLRIYSVIMYQMAHNFRGGFVLSTDVALARCSIWIADDAEASNCRLLSVDTYIISETLNWLWEHIVNCGRMRIVWSLSLRNCINICWMVYILNIVQSSAFCWSSDDNLPFMIH